MKNVLKLLVKVVSIPLGLTAAASQQTQEYIIQQTTLIISNEEMKDIIKVVKSFEESNLLILLIKDVRQTFENETKEQKGEFLSMLLGTLGAILLLNL